MSSNSANGKMVGERQLPLVDLTEAIRTLPKHYAGPRLGAFYKFMRVSRLGLVLFILIAVTMGFFPLVGTALPVYVLLAVGVPHWPLRRYIDLCIASWMSIMTTVYEHILGLRIRTFGHGEKFRKRSLIVMNHCSYFDWMYFWSVSDRQGDLTFWKVITSRLPLKILPVIGQCVQLACYVFLDRRWERDREEFRRKLYYYNVLGYPVQMLMFPEGGDFNPYTKVKSNKFADANDLPHLQYCFYPRTTGFVYTMNALRDGGLDAVYDMTIAYPDMLPKDPEELVYNILPQEVHYHVTKYENGDLPENKDGLKEWIQNRWIEKDERLRKFYSHREFRDVGDKKVAEVRRPRNVGFLVQVVVFVLLLNAVVMIPLWYFPYAGCTYMLVSMLFMGLMHRKGLGHAMLYFKGKEIEEAAKSSSRNRDI